MKPSKFILFISILLILSEVAEAQNFFPMKSGNKYQFGYYWQFHGPGGTSSGYSYGKYTIGKDSVINGQTFYKFNQTHLQLFFSMDEDDFLFRYDSTQQKLFVKIPNEDTVRLAVDFNVPADSVFTSYIKGSPAGYRSQGITIDTVFGYPVEIFKMTYNFYSENGSYTFADKFGLIRSDNIWWESTLNGSTSNSIFSAIIDSTIYNPIILEITDVHPLIDRPIDTFPFVLHANYSSSLPPTIDSFYVDIIHTRADTVLHQWRKEFSGYQVNVPLYPEMLEVGDIVKIRATITDESIFENVDHYPDSGYALINVLDPVTGLEENKSPNEYSLSQNYPNPFNPSTVIEYSLSEPGKVTLRVYNLLAVEVALLVNEEQPAGEHRVLFDADKFNLPSGVYFYKLTGGDFVDVKKMILTR